MDMAKTYEPKSFEQKLYKNWQEKGYFTAKVDKSKTPFSIVMPPPNITGQLHMGHALDETIQDIIIRFKRMQGYSTLWLPGTDHASIATEVKIVEQMKSEGVSKADIGRDGFMERAWAWKDKFGGRIIEQLKSLGSSCDWSRTAFTMDERCSRAVKEVFVKLYEKGLIYQGDRIINWCPTCKTALSDAEVDYEEMNSNLWHIKYPAADGSDDYIIVATTRPETMLGDTAVAVHPTDERYSALIGKQFELPLTGRTIPVVADEYVEKDFGSGAVKITPAHDPNDFEVGLRHNLEVIRVMNDDGTMNEKAGVYAGLDRQYARKRIVADLEKGGYLVKIEPHVLNAGHCYRCKDLVEPIVSKQWFVKMAPLAEPAIKAVKDKRIKFIPKRFEKTYFNWMENIRDWCISRQLWWGHRIPVYYCDECGEVMVSVDAPDKCRKCGSVNLRQDEDVLDTWFSSALWPFSTLGYPEKTEELEYFYPTNVLVTGYDIIFFWVARMIFSGLEHMNDIPFSEVLIHGIMRDSQGRKMSKSLGNGIDPLEIIDQYGADTLRFSLSVGIAPGNDSRYTNEKLENCRNFINKVWNASRFVIMNLEGKKLPEIGTFKPDSSDKWIATRLNKVIAEVTKNLSKYEIGLASAKLYDFVWSEFCDWYIEMSKTALYGDSEKVRSEKLSFLVYVLGRILKLLHPFIPFVTEEIYSNLPTTDESIMISEWPLHDKRFNSKAEESFIEGVKEIVKSIRNLRAEMQVAPSKKMSAVLVTKVAKYKKGTSIIEKLAGLTSMKVVLEKPTELDKVITAVTGDAEILIPMAELVDKAKEIERLTKEKESVEFEIKRSSGMLANERFTSKAPVHLVEAEKAKLAKYNEMLEKINTKLVEIEKF